MNTKTMFSSKNSEWETPQKLFNVINEICYFNTDVCASPDNAKCSMFWTEKDDGLNQLWQGMCWMNPPYGRAIIHWMKKAYESSLSPGVTVVCLVPARTDTEWWHQYAMAGQVIFLRGRLKFGGHKNCAPFPSALVIFGGNMNRIWSRLQQGLFLAGINCH